MELAGGALLLANRYVPLALVLLGPVIVNIFFYHLLMDRSGLIIAIVVIILWGLVALRHRQYFSGLFVQALHNCVLCLSAAPHSQSS